MKRIEFTPVLPFRNTRDIAFIKGIRTTVFGRHRILMIRWRYWLITITLWRLPK